MLKEVGVGEPKLDFGGVKLKVVHSKAFEEAADVGGVGRGVRIEKFVVVEVGCYVVVEHLVTSWMTSTDQPGAALLP